MRIPKYYTAADEDASPAKRIVMSILRIVLGVLVGVGICVLIGVCGRQFPGVTLFVFCCGYCALTIWKIVSSIKSGRLTTKYSVYEIDSIWFWFFILAFAFVAIFAIGAGFHALLHPPR